MVNIKELIGTTEYVTRYMRRRINRCCYNQIRLCMCVCLYIYIYI